MRKLISLPALLLLAACSSAEPPTEPASEPSGEPAAAPAQEEPAPGVEGDAVAAPRAASVNLNTATDAEFKAAVPGLGDKMVHEFEEYRPYVSIVQFRKEMGKYVDADTIATYERYVFVPVAFNDCDADTLAQLPGVDIDTANGLIAKRPFADQAAFLSALGESVEPAQVEAAKAMLAQ
ncbi:MAG: hypothetical protein VX899_10575 [Myxococcota bacterium]|nr:hypothetical protein [Myxococcota bacterium]